MLGVSLTTDASEQDDSVSQLERWTLVTKKGVITFKDPQARRLCLWVQVLVSQGRWPMLRVEQDHANMIKALPGWIAEVDAEECSRPSPRPLLRFQ